MEEIVCLLLGFFGAGLDCSRFFLVCSTPDMGVYCAYALKSAGLGCSALVSAGCCSLAPAVFC